MLKVGIIGVGSISAAHINAWNSMDDVKLVAMCDIRPERMDQYSDVNKYTSFEDMMANEKLDILDICLPTFLHIEYSIKAMDMGINVLCEKPISLNRDEVKKVYDAAKRNNVKFMVAQVLRFWTEFLFVKELFDSQKYGKLISGNMARISSMPRNSWDGWMTDEKRSGFTPYDLHIHDLDFMVYAFGKPDTVHVNRSKLPNQDSLAVAYTFGDAYITTEATWYHAKVPFDASFRFQFEKAVVTYRSRVLNLYEYDEAHNLSEGETGAEIEYDVPKSSGYANEIRYFADCVINDTQPDRVKPEELETVIDILNTL